MSAKANKDNLVGTVSTDETQNRCTQRSNMTLQGIRFTIHFDQMHIPFGFIPLSIFVIDPSQPSLKTNLLMLLYAFANDTFIGSQQ